jgi:DNA-binding transcriptional regulator YbjK
VEYFRLGETAARRRESRQRFLNHRAVVSSAGIPKTPPTQYRRDTDAMPKAAFMRSFDD